MNAAVPPAAGEDDLDDLRGLLVRNPVNVEALLHRLRSQRCLLSVRPDGSAQWFSSLLLTVDRAGGRLDLDALNPAPKQLPAPNTPLTIRAHLDGGDVRLRTTLTGHLAVDDAPALQIAFPEALFMVERRGAYRLPLPPHLSLPSLEVVHEETTYQARPVDISTLGTGAVLKARLDAPVGTPLRCRFDIGGTPFEADAELRSVQQVRDGFRVGLQFHDVPPAQQQQLQRAIHVLERQLIRSARHLR